MQLDAARKCCIALSKTTFRLDAVGAGCLQSLQSLEAALIDFQADLPTYIVADETGFV
jgi:hypothetical protein